MELTKDQEIVQQVITEAWSNPDFKRELIKDPNAAIHKLTGKTLSIPTGKTLKVYDQSSPDVACLNIPPKVDMDNVELSDQQLENAAGGSYFHLWPYSNPLICFPDLVISHGR